MKKSVLRGLWIGSVLLVTPTAPSAAQHIGAGPMGMPGDPGQGCAACHGTHKPDQGVASLRLGDGELHVAGSIAPRLGDGSLSCLRCHSTAMQREAVARVDGMPRLTVSEGRYLGFDFADDHPLGRIEADRRLLPAEGIRGFRSGRLSGGDRTLRVRFRDEIVECTSCHDPHSRTGPIPTPEEEAMLCGSCHDLATYAFGMHSSVTCSDCHSLHGAKGDALLPEHNEDRMCESCHDGIGVIPSTYDSRDLRLLIIPTGHVVAPGGRCGDCHPAHGTPSP